MIIKAYAKINLGLWIMGKREDGYHEIKTIFHPIDLYDEIEINKSELVKIKCDEGPEGDKNIAIKVLEELSKYKNKFYGAEIYIKKNIPIGGGLGGGSSDAASILKALNEIYLLNLTNEEMYNIAKKIGSDVPYFLDYGTMKGEGRGDILENISTDFKGNFFIFYPGFEINSAWAYSEIDKIYEDEEMIKKKEEKFYNVLKYLEEKKYEEFIKEIENDFEKVIFKYYPFFVKIKDLLISKGAKKVMLAGSGSSLWAYFEKRIEENFNFGFGKIFWTKSLNWGVV
ncbi:MAG: 4-(cytidine 5'-diphospho)-2-C-methyl-D-erythritol kinase [candidate division WOR-3 bacterium]